MHGSISSEPSSGQTRVRNCLACTVGIRPLSTRESAASLDSSGVEGCVGSVRVALARCGEDRVQEVVESRGGDADGAVGGAVVEANLVAAGVVNKPAGEDDVWDVACALVWSERRKDPVGETSQDARRLVEVEQGEPDPIDLAADRVLDAVVEEQPAVIGPKRRRPDADTQGVPPGAFARLEHLLGSAPADEVVGAR